MQNNWTNDKAATLRRFLNGAVGKELFSILEARKPRVESKDFQEAALLGQRRFGQEDVLTWIRQLAEESDDTREPIYQPVDTTK